MSRYFGSTISLAALAAVLAATSPASAQQDTLVLDTEIEGPITSITLAPAAAAKQEAVPVGVGLPNAEAGDTVVGTIRVMGVNVKVRSDATIYTPTNDNLSPLLTTTPAGEEVFNTRAGLSKLAVGQMPGRPEQGFLGGTAIIIGDSYNGTFYARDVFSDLFEHVVVGEATAMVDSNADNIADRLTLNGMQIVASTDKRMPAGKPINGFGFQIDPDKIPAGSLISAEGYYSAQQNVHYYHTLEADNAPLLNAASTEVSIMRADCRIRGGGRDEMEVRGGIHFPAGTTADNNQVTIKRPKDGVANPRRGNPADWETIGFSDPAVFDTTVSPPQATYRFDGDDLNLGACPTILRAHYQGPEKKAAFATFHPESR